MRWEYRLIFEAVKGKKDSEIGYLYGKTNGYDSELQHIKKSPLTMVAIFDMDQTLITTKSKRRFPIDDTDWKWNYSSVKDILNKYHEMGYQIIIITNQAGIKSNENKLQEFKQKLQAIETDIIKSFPDITFQVFCAIHKDIHRKPFPTFCKDIKFDRNQSFFCGDAAGRVGDHSDSDIKFAYNTRLIFRTPEYIFLNDKTSKGVLNYPIVPYSPEVLNTKKYMYIQNSLSRPELIVVVGLPASGKTYIVNSIVNECKINWIKVDIISLDVIKSKPKMINILKQYAILKNTIIVDNTNLEVSTRTEIIKTVKDIYSKYYVRILHINTPLERCIHNNFYRYFVNHHNDPKIIPDFVYKMMIKKFIKPKKAENKYINIIETINPGIPIDPRYLYYY